MQLIIISLILAVTTHVALAAIDPVVKLGWTDTNAESAKVIRYNVYDASAPTTPLLVVDEPKTTDGSKEITADVTKAFAGKTVYVTAFNALGLESVPSEKLSMPTLSLAPTGIKLAFDFASRTIEVSWTPSANAFASGVNGYIVYAVTPDNVVEVARTTDAQTVRVSVQFPATTDVEYVVTARGFWGESAVSEGVAIPSVVVPVTNLRLLRSP